MTRTILMSLVGGGLGFLASQTGGWRGVAWLCIGIVCGFVIAVLY